MPACLYQHSEVNETNVEAMGWGATSYSGMSSAELLKGYLKVIANSECNRSYEDDVDELPTGILASQICAGDSSKQRDTW